MSLGCQLFKLSEQTNLLLNINIHCAFSRVFTIKAFNFIIKILVVNERVMNFICAQSETDMESFNFKQKGGEFGPVTVVFLHLH